MTTARSSFRAATVFAFCSLALSCSRGVRRRFARGGTGGGPPAARLPPMPVEMSRWPQSRSSRASEFVASLKSRRSTTIQPRSKGSSRASRCDPARASRAAPCCSRSIRRPSRRRSPSLQSMRPMRESDVEFARQQVERNKTLLDRRRDQPARGRAVRDAAPRRRGAAEGARRADSPAAQSAELLPRHRARSPAPSATSRSTSAIASRVRRC